jgi:hypothetical protein
VKPGGTRAPAKLAKRAIEIGTMSTVYVTYRASLRFNGLVSTIQAVVNTYGIPGNGCDWRSAEVLRDVSYWIRIQSFVPHDDRGQLDGARIKVISDKPETPAFATWDPLKGPFSRGVLDEVPSNAKEDNDVKHEAKQRGHPLLRVKEGNAVNMDTGSMFCLL